MLGIGCIGQGYLLPACDDLQGLAGGDSKQRTRQPHDGLDCLGLPAKGESVIRIYHIVVTFMSTV